MQIISNIYDGQYKITATATNITLISEYNINKKPIKLVNSQQSQTNSVSTSQSITIMSDPIPYIILYQNNE